MRLMAFRKRLNGFTNERRYYMKVIKKLKTCVAVVALSAIAITATSISADALKRGNISYDGCRTYSSYGYRSYTTASGYDSKGVGLSIGVKSSMGGDTYKDNFNTGNVSVYSKYSAYGYPDQHWVFKGTKKSYVQWDYFVYNT